MPVHEGFSGGNGEERQVSGARNKRGGAVAGSTTPPQPQKRRKTMAGMIPGLAAKGKRVDQDPGFGDSPG
jgi:hypothetical protein